jgi:hypothetical protein
MASALSSPRAGALSFCQMIFGLTKFRTAGETQDTRFFELEFSWHGA